MRANVRPLWLFAVASVLLSLAATLLDVDPASAVEHDAPATHKGCRYQPRDDIGRCPLLAYKVIVSRDDAVCEHIADALNRAPLGPNKLYSDPIFVPWRVDGNANDPASPPLFLLKGATWIEAPIFNDGRLLAVELSRYGPLGLIPFTDPLMFGRFLKNREGPRPTLAPNNMLMLIAKATTAQGLYDFPRRRLIDFPMVSEKYQRSLRWGGRNNVGEFNWASLRGTIFLVARIYYREIIYIVKFEPDSYSDICYLAPDRWWESHGNGRLVEHKSDD